MKKGTKKKRKILIVLTILAIIVICPIHDVKAESLPLYFGDSNTPISPAPYARFYNNNNGTLTAVTTNTILEYATYTANMTITSDGYGGAIVFDVPEGFYSGITYSLTIFLGTNSSSIYFKPSVKWNYISLGGNLGAAASNLQNGYTYNVLRYKSSTIGTFTLYNPNIDMAEGYYSNYITYVFTPNANYSTVAIPFNTAQSTPTNYPINFYGYHYEVLGNLDNLTTEEIQSVISSSGLATASSVAEIQTSVNEVKTELNEVNSSIDEQTQQQQQNHDEIMNSDISEADKELPDDSGYQDYTQAEDELKDKMSQADMTAISIGIDVNSSNWVWDTLTSLIQTHSVVFGMFIAILSIGIIKLALGR